MPRDGTLLCETQHLENWSFEKDWGPLEKQDKFNFKLLVVLVHLIW